MKKILSALVLTMLGYYGMPQNLKNSSASKNPEVSAPISVNESTKSASVSAKAIKNLNKTFKNVSDAKWYDMPDGYRAKFTTTGAQSDISYKVDYDKRGNWTHTIRTYNEKELARDIRQQVKMSYFDYAIVSVDEILMPRNQRTYVIHLEGSTDWVNVRIADGEMDEFQRYYK